VAREQILTVNS